MGVNQSFYLSHQVALGPWNATRPLPVPWTLNPLADHEMNVLIVISGLSLFIWAVVLLLIILEIHRKNVCERPAKRDLSTARTQFTILLAHLLLAQVLLSAGYLLSTVHLASGRIISPSIPCTIQGLLIKMAHLLSHCLITCIAVHTFHVVQFKKPMQVQHFCIMLALTWLQVATIGFLFPLALQIWYRSVMPVFMLGNLMHCSVGSIWRAEKIATVLLPFLVNNLVAFVVYPVVSYRLRKDVNELKRLSLRGISSGGSQSTNSKGNNDILRVSRKMIILPIATFVSTMPYVLTVIFAVHSGGVLQWSHTLIVCTIVANLFLPLINSLLYIHMLPHVRSSSSHARGCN
ncbi:hypothetical protein BCR37DRAFT_262090 [Protomyces lactucae-debilis]|uniref:G-protein coupled receptors family 1 profile domain-containing protein n=1 Tax=Protomyces lactucae-debilis TaxID=2754530 RepID=A0A1Y2FNF1_PROLT|nr:uncharacterized protein BCR37DRAFT_262090 [Protomyces lactucae-debilis]ORY84255.1 hypothetical protein BCR37DRAFT_262090 [Protomyces lactucae-debilis]